MPSILRLVIITAVVAIGITWSVLGLLLPARRRAIELDRRLVCGSNLKHIATSWSIYGESYPDGAPPILDWLVAEGHISRDATICAVARPPESNYVFVPLEGGAMDNRTVVAYEPKSNHLGIGGTVVFADGHAKLVTGEEYDRLVAEASARIQRRSNPSLEP